MSVVDFLVFNHILNGVQKSVKERFSPYDEDAIAYAAVPSNGGYTTIPVSLKKGEESSAITTGSAGLISIIMAVTAAYLAWTCDFTHSGNFAIKVLQTIVAASFGSLFIIFYIIFLLMPCNNITF